MKPLAAIAALMAGSPLAAQTRQSVPTADTEDATLGSVDVGPGSFHAFATFDVRNGDYARGALDDDDASLDRVPVHAAIGFAGVLHRDTDGAATVFVIGQSSNGFHAPRADERTSPRSWYESNNLLGLAWRPVDGLTTAALYTIKASPNGVAPTSHEASISLLYDADTGIGRLKPRFAATMRPKGDTGVYILTGIAPEHALGGDDAPTLSIPMTIGVGFGGFYAEGSGDRVFGSAGLSLAQPVRLGGIAASLNAEILALVRDDRLRRLDAPGGTTATIVPLATLSLRVML